MIEFIAEQLVINW